MPSVPNQALKSHRNRLFPLGVAAAGLIFLVALSAPCGFSQNSSTQGTYLPPMVPHPILLPEANRPLDANALQALRDKQANKANFEKANIERKRQMTEDSEMLLKLANELKSEIDKSSMGALSAADILRAEEIEHLAHNVQQKMKLTIAAN